MRCINVFYYTGAYAAPRAVVGRECKSESETKFAVKVMNAVLRTPSCTDGFILRYRLKGKIKKKNERA